MESSFLERFCDLQSRVKVGKDNYNKFGEYNYRNIEQMMDVVKPIAHELGIIVYFQDSIVNIGDRFYVKADAIAMPATKDGTQHCKEQSLCASGFAREVMDKKKNDPAQITGMASSYARKYALSALLAIGTGQPDPDSLEHPTEPQEAPQQPAESVGRDISEFSDLMQTLADASGVQRKSLIDAFISQHGNPRHISDAAYRAALTQIKGEIEKLGIEKHGGSA